MQNPKLELDQIKLFEVLVTFGSICKHTTNISMKNKLTLYEWIDF